MTPTNRCPPGCREPRCNHLLEYTVTLEGKAYPNDQCVKRVPMWDNCPWHSDKESNHVHQH